MFLSSATTDRCACDNIMQLIFICLEKVPVPAPSPQSPTYVQHGVGGERKSYLDHNPSHLYVFFASVVKTSVFGPTAEECLVDSGRKLLRKANYFFLQQQTATSWAMHFSLYPFEKSTLSLDVLARNFIMVGLPHLKSILL